jgi:hypothetical protein
MRLLAAFLLLCGCPSAPAETPDPIDVSIDPGCSWALSAHCGLPWPDSRWLVDDPSTATGRRLVYEPTVLPANIDGVAFDPSEWERLDGFSPAAHALTAFPRPVDLDGLATIDGYDRSLEADSPTVLIDLETGEHIPHFVENDVRWFDGTDEGRTDIPVIFYLRPAIRLREDGWYGVALRGITLEDGSAAPVEPVFAALRDAVPTASAVVEAARPRYEAMFAAMESAGVPRGDLVQAWDWHTASGDAVRGDLLAMRDDALLRLTDEAIQCTVDRVVEPEDGRVARRVEGTFKAPLYMDADATGSHLVRDASGAPAFQGWADVPFTVSIPRSLAADGAAPGRLVQFGHGLMGQGREEIKSGFNTRFSDDYGVVFVATDWQGMTRADLITVARALADLSGFSAVADRLLQGMVGQVALTRSFLGPCRDLPELQVHGAPAYADDEAYFIGISQGGILGGTFLTISPDITRGALLVGSTNFPATMIRSLNWREYELILKAWYDERIGRELGVSIIGSLWDRAEPNAWLPHLTAGDLTGTPPKQVLYQLGRHDLQVQNVMSEVAVRDLGIPVLSPTPRSIWGVPELPEPLESAAVYFDLHGTPPPETNELPEAVNNVHNDQRNLDVAMAQIDAFLRPDGAVVSTCDGACDPD